MVVGVIVAVDAASVAADGDVDEAVGVTWDTAGVSSSPAAAVSREVALSAVQPSDGVDHEAVNSVVEVVDAAGSVTATVASGSGGSSRVSSLK